MSTLLRSIPFVRASYKIGKPHTIPAVQLQRTLLAFQNDRRYLNGFGGPSPGQIGPQADDVEEPPKAEKDRPRSQWSATLFKMFESAAATFASLLILG